MLVDVERGRYRRSLTMLSFLKYIFNKTLNIIHLVTMLTFDQVSILQKITPVEHDVKI